MASLKNYNLASYYATNMIETWPKLTKNEWIKLVEKELRGKPYQSIIHNISKNISIEPYYTSDEIDEQYPPLISDNDWQIAENFYFANGDEVKLNTDLLEALDGGLQSPTINFADIPELETLKIILKEIELKYISVFFKFQNKLEPEKVAEFLQNICFVSGLKTEELKGGLMLSSDSDLIILNQYPNLRTLHIQIEDNWSENEPDDLLFQILKRAHIVWNNLPKLQSEQLANKFYFTIRIGNDYLLEIAKIRALYVLWGNYQLANGLESPLKPFVNIEFRGDAYDSDTNKNLIKSSTMALAAITGGGSRITVLPAGDNETPFQRRIARNVLNLLELESGLKNISDPAAGSYYIENLTHLIADSAWKMFIKR